MTSTDRGVAPRAGGTSSPSWNLRAPARAATPTGTSPHYIKGVKAVLNNVVIVPTASPVDIKKGITAALVRNAEVESRHITVTTYAVNFVRLTPEQQRDVISRTFHESL